MDMMYNRKGYFKAFVMLMLSFIFICCNNNEDISADPTQTDISISTSASSITWITADDLLPSIENALSYNYGNALESETQKQQIFNADSSSVTASISFKSEFADDYVDTNPNNNSVTITLIKEPQPVELKADGPGNTYGLITSVLAPGHNPIETPDCSHPAFGDHIDEIFDMELNTNVFRFHIHVSPDNDRCINFDRQRNEIKTYNQSPDNLLGTQNETVDYNWKFKLATGFQSSPNFTHIHQLKSVGGDLDGMPMYTLTTRKSSPDRLELRYAETDNQITLSQTDLEPLIGTWLEVTETITYGATGSYNIEIQKVSDGSVLFTYSNPSLVNWRPNADFVRPKWGIYRSLINDQDLRDETVLFADFSITEID